MYASLIELEHLEFSRVKYYSALIEDRPASEFLDFQQRMRKLYPIQLGELNAYIKEIGEFYGAQKRFFRHERIAHALPPHFFEYEGKDEERPENGFGLRLYCLRLNESVVILFNGDLKTAQLVQDCDNCRKHFDLANRISKGIDAAIRGNEIMPEDKRIVGFENLDLEI